MLPSVTAHSLLTKSVVMSVAVSKLKVGVVPCRASSENLMDSIGGIFYYVNSNTPFACTAHGVRNIV